MAALGICVLPNLHTKKKKRINVSFSEAVTPHLNEHLKGMNVQGIKRLIWDI